MRKQLVTTALILAVFDFAHAWCVKTKTAELRSGPGRKNPVTWVVPRYTPLLEVERQGEWIKVADLDGENHWVAANVVTKKIVCLAVNVASARVRKAPGAQGALADIRQVDRYTPFKRIDMDGAWYQVESSSGEVYWIHGDMTWRPVRTSRVDLSE